VHKDHTERPPASSIGRRARYEAADPNASAGDAKDRLQQRFSVEPIDLAPASSIASQIIVWS
jgi:hypothetical protein